MMFLVPWALTPAAVDKRIQEPERWVRPGRQKSFVLVFPRFRKAIFSLLPCADSFQGRLPPERPRATPAHHLGSRLMADVFQTATLEEQWELASKDRVIAARCPPLATAPHAL